MKTLVLAAIFLGATVVLASSDVLEDEGLLDLDHQISEPLRQQNQDSKIELPEEKEPEVVENHGYPCDPSRSECVRPNQPLYDGKNPLKPLPKVHKN